MRASLENLIPEPLPPLRKPLGTLQSADPAHALRCSPAPPPCGAWPVPFPREVDSGEPLEAWAWKHRCAHWHFPASQYGSAHLWLLCVCPDACAGFLKIWGGPTVRPPPPPGNVRTGRRDGSVRKPGGPPRRGPAPCLPATRRFPTAQRRRAAPPRLRPAGRGRGGTSALPAWKPRLAAGGGSNARAAGASTGLCRPPQPWTRPWRR